MLRVVNALSERPSADSVDLRNESATHEPYGISKTPTTVQLDSNPQAAFQAETGERFLSNL